MDYELDSFENRGHLPNYGRITVDTATVPMPCHRCPERAAFFLFSVLEGYRLNLTTRLRSRAMPPQGREVSDEKTPGGMPDRIRSHCFGPRGFDSKVPFHTPAADPGFRADHVLTTQMSLPSTKYANNPQRLAFYNQLLDRLRSLPQVESWERASTFPSAKVRVGLISGSKAARAGPRRGASNPDHCCHSWILGRYRTFSHQRRFITEQDGPNALPVVVISQTLAGRFFLRTPWGAKLRLGRDKHYLVHHRRHRERR